MEVCIKNQHLYFVPQLAPLNWIAGIKQLNSAEHKFVSTYIENCIVISLTGIKITTNLVVKIKL